jgi:hypothetical protein
MTSKRQAIVSGTIAAVSQFIGWLATIPPESQTAFVQPMLDALPVSWRTPIGVWMKLLSGISMSYAIYKAAHSGPQTPPKNPPE